MPRTFSAEFETRRDAEMTVEHLVQEYDIDRKSVTVLAATDQNTAGTRVAGSDTEGGVEKSGANAEAALSGRVRVSVDVADELADKVRETFTTYKGKQVED